MTNHHYKNSIRDNIFDIFVYALLIVGFIVVLYPLYFVLIASFSDPTLVNAGKVFLFPRESTWKGYLYIFKDYRLLTGYRNTILYSVGYTLISVILIICAAYPLANPTLVGRRFFNFLIVFSMYFNGGLVPTYIVVKNLHLINKPILICVLGALSAFYIIIARTFFETSIPKELIESASIDGANQAKSFFLIALPLSKPIVTVLALYAFVSQWNSYFNAMMFLNDAKYYPLQLVLRQILLMSQALQDSTTNISISDVVSASEQQKLADTIKYGVIIVSSVPLLIVFPFFQKYFAQGMMIGAIKG